jgi:hypothetical protein
VTVSCEPGTVLERGPEVRTQTVRFLDKDLGRARMEEIHRFAGVVRDPDGAPVANAWVVLDQVGWAATDPEGRFRFDRVLAGKYACKVRGPEGSEAAETVAVPGAIVDLVLGGAPKKRARASTAKGG